MWLQSSWISYLWIFLGSIKLYLKNLIFGTKQCHSTIEQVSKNKYTITYSINDKIYKIIIRPNRKPHPVYQIRDSEGLDVTDHIVPYMGPEYNYHGSKITPTDLGHMALTIQLDNDHEYTITENQIIYHNNHEHSE